MARSRKKPLAQLEHGTRIYEPSSSKARYRVVANDPNSGDCYTSASLAAVDDAIADGVDAINYSISGATDTVVDLERLR